MSQEITFEQATDSQDYRRVSALLGNQDGLIPNTPENISRDRLLRVNKGLCHLLAEVIPQISDVQQRQEISLWVGGIYFITRCEEFDADEQMTAIQQEAK